ncbi:NACHT domain-containing protein [Streptomyces sp. NPDC012935]|uniref:NACHT domain-containing protein n=1 Tax=Streptomyces sp. NPDC012935 TaxID=3364857 RepID=UPI0036CE11A6
MIAGRISDLAVVVVGEGQGSGVLLGRSLVLTARHVVDGSDVVEVIHPSSRKPVECEIIWDDEALDAALLRADPAVISAERAAPLGRPRVGRVASASPLSHCQIVGFPQSQRYGGWGDDLEYEQYRATVLPMAGRMRNLLVCELDVPAADERGEQVSPLAGLSGAPVFAGAVLLGVVTQVPRGRSHLRIEAAPIEAAMTSVRRVRWNPTFEEITDVHPKDELFEARYAKDLAAQYRKTEIFGIEELGRTESRWDLDTAYLSLEAEAAAQDGHKGARASAQRIEPLLKTRPRALLRGQAGAGKTTLVWWLAAHAANGTLTMELAQLNGLVPFVIPMREVYARGGPFPAVSELLSAGRVISDDAPEGWASRVLEADRGLLLVDGLDEVPPDEREKARRWLSALLDRYPQTRCLATVRPDAVEKDWLRSEGFTELTLLPMSDEDIQSFVIAWHNAARLESEHLYEARRCGDEKELLSSLEQDLAHQLEQNAALRDLARTPLLSGVICALHRRRRGLLPTTRWSLYRAALGMLLGGRDAARGVSRTDDISLDSDAQHALLQRLSIWLVRTGQQQMTPKLATHQLALAMRDMPQIRAQASPLRVLRFLVERSGVLQERADDAIQFIHRTFQDYLAAKEFHESGYVLELLNHAGDEAWRDVIVLAVGHATRTDAQLLIERLVQYGDVVDGREEKWYLHVLAAQCATSLLSLDAVLMEVVRGRVRTLMPPRNYSEAGDIASLGAWAVELLPGPGEGDGSDEYVVEALTRIRAAEARGKLRRFASHPGIDVRLPIAQGWIHQPAEEYAREVLAGSGIHSLYVQSSSQLVQLPHLEPLRAITVDGSYTAEELDAHLPTQHVEVIILRRNWKITHLHFLRTRQRLRVLELDLPKGSLDLLTSLTPLPNIRRLQLNGVRDYADMTQLPRVFPNLKGLTLQLEEGATEQPDPKALGTEALGNAFGPQFRMVVQ